MCLNTSTEGILKRKSQNTLKATARKAGKKASEVHNLLSINWVYGCSCFFFFFFEGRLLMLSKIIRMIFG